MYWLIWPSSQPFEVSIINRLIFLQRKQWTEVNYSRSDGQQGAELALEPKFDSKAWILDHMPPPPSSGSETAFLSAAILALLKHPWLMGEGAPSLLLWACALLIPWPLWRPHFSEPEFGYSIWPRIFVSYDVIIFSSLNWKLGQKHDSWIVNLGRICWVPETFGRRSIVTQNSMRMMGEHISHLHHLETQAFFLTLFKREIRTFSTCGFALYVGTEGERRWAMRGSLYYLENGMIHFDSPFSLPYPLRLSIQIISLLFQRTKWQKQNIALDSWLIYKADSQQIAIKLTLGLDRSVLPDPNCSGIPY